MKTARVLAGLLYGAVLVAIPPLRGVAPVLKPWLIGW